MLLIVLALFWVALLVPIVVRRFRDGGTEKSIDHFHVEHEVLSRQDYTVTPAHRLDRPDQSTSRSQASDRRPRLTVVHDDDTYSALESRTSWDEWNDDYEYDATASTHQPREVQTNRYYNAPVNARASRREVSSRYSESPADVEESRQPSMNRYVRAYSSHPADDAVSATFEAPLRRRSMKSRRRVIFTRLVLFAVVMTIVAFVSGSTIVFDLAALSLLGVVAFIALAFYSVNQGLLSDSSLPVRVPQRRPLATIEPLYTENFDRNPPQYEDEFDDEFYEPEADVQWQRQPQRRRALG
jgi:hypothetical protein